MEFAFRMNNKQKLLLIGKRQLVVIWFVDVPKWFFGNKANLWITSIKINLQQIYAYLFVF